MIVMADGGLYETRRASTGAGWSPRVKLPAAVNVNGSEIGAVFSPSGRSLLFFLLREGGAEAWPPECPARKK
jgi:hypothetical protein